MIDEEYNWKGKKILITEDEEINYLFLERVLAPTNVTIVRACNGREAIDMAVGDSKIDLVLMDIRMPEINGIDATIEIRKQRPNLPVIAHTCYDTDLNLSSLPNVKFDGFISKPVNISKMMRLINQYMQ
ncbi:MAG: response regulator [Salinivirgaceae bacterium]|nr:response regulator [Salinivirgaceae bacterium]